MEQFSQAAPLFESRIRSLKKVHQGKVRDIYDVDSDHLLIVTTDRLSAFDVVLPDPIPFKGEVLTRISLFWFAKTRHIVPNHLSGLSFTDVIVDPDERAQLAGRAMVVKKLHPLPLEAVVRGYLIGSGYKDYQRHGSVCGIPLPAGRDRQDGTQMAGAKSPKVEIREAVPIGLDQRPHALRHRSIRVHVQQDGAGIAHQ